MENSGFQSRRVVVAIVIVALIVVIAAVVGGLATRRYGNYLSGLWVGDPGFLEKAQLKDIQLFLAPRETGGRRQGYLIMTDLDGQFVSNQAIEVRERSPVRQWWTALGSAFRAQRDVCVASRVDVEYDDAKQGAESPMPGRMKMAVSMADGTLTFYDNDKVYAYLVKDLATSAAAVEAYRS